MRVRRCFQIVTLLGSLAVCSALGEWLWRAAVHDRYRRDRELFSERLYELVDSGAIYDLRPDADVTETIADPQGGPPTVVRYRTNAERMPVHATWPPPRDANVRRVLFVGDSYTFGSAIAEGDAWPFQTQAELARQGTAIFAINGGVPGYNSQQVLVRLRELLARHEPQHVVYGFVMNDAEPPVFGVLPPADVYREAWSWLAADARHLAGWLTMALVDDRSPWAPLRQQYAGDYRASFAPGVAKARDCRRAVVAMHEACRARGVGFTVAILPDFTQPFDDTYAYRGIHEQVVAWGREAGFATVDTFTGLCGADAAAMHVPGDGHPTREGHRRLAVQIAARLAEQFRG
ncbi:MAG: GDSL-type esterase/lipase family protein [Planctomycetota bacterium]